MQEQGTDIYGNKIDWSEGFGYEDEAGLEDESYFSTKSGENTTKESSQTQTEPEDISKNQKGYKFGFGEVFIIIFIAISFVYLFISKRGTR